MLSTRQQVQQHYGERIRVRACGVLIKNDKVLMLKHDGIGVQNYYWSVPGGEPLASESLVEAVRREMMEEVNLVVKVGSLLHINEFIEKPLHAIELYFKVTTKDYEAKLGKDPETPEINILSEMKWFSKKELNAMSSEIRPHFLAKIWP